jgi:DNA topoisomerase I
MPRLRRSDLNGPGISRRRCGRGFTYQWSTGVRVADPEVFDRITDLAIPPAWKDVWICPWPNGHIQAIGVDAAGRRQYRYHDAWRRHRDREKFERILDFGQALPNLRKSVTQDLSSRGLSRKRVAAVGVRLLDIGCFRVGNVEYADEHETFGISTLRLEHVKVGRRQVAFEYSAKGSIERTLTVEDPDVVRTVAALCRRRDPGEDLLAWKDKTSWVNVGAAELNDYIKEVAGEQFSAKDFRTWSGTVYAAVELAKRYEIGASQRSRQRAATAAIKEVATVLGNTPAVCRSSYVDPRLFDCYEAGETIADALAKIRDTSDYYKVQRRVESAVLQLLAQATQVAA